MGIDDDTRRIRIEFSKGIENITGMNVPDMDRLRDRLRPGMERGDVTFTLDKAGVGGTLDLGPDGKIKINGSNEAIFLLGLQQEAIQKKKS